jgi:predicted dehydrogenase
MWAGPPVLNGIYDVEESCTGIIRTTGPTITIHGAWAQNINNREMYIDFMGDKGGIRLEYGKGFTYYTAEDGKLVEEVPDIDTSNLFAEMFQNEINAFVKCVQTGEKLPSHIDNAIISAKILFIFLSLPIILYSVYPLIVGLSRNSPLPFSKRHLI